jgi:hypothetical protein
MFLPKLMHGTFPNEMKAWAFNLNVSFQYSQMEGKKPFFALWCAFLVDELNAFIFFPPMLKRLTNAHKSWYGHHRLHTHHAIYNRHGLHLVDHAYSN